MNASDTHGARPFTRRQTVVGLRWMLATAALWGAYTPIASVSGSIFTGFALWLGASASRIAMLSAMFYLAGLVQPFSLFLTNRVANKKFFLVIAGSAEIVLTLSVVGIPEVLPPQWRVAALATMVLLGFTASNLLLPTYNTWMSTLIPEPIRGRYLSKRTAVLYASMIVFGYAASRFIDAFPEESRYTGFVCVFVFGIVMGIAGYLAAGQAPSPPMQRVMPLRFGDILRVPVRDRAFGKFLAFYAAWVVGAGFSIPFISVFLLKELGLPYAHIALYTNICMAVMIVGFQFWGRIVDLMGAKNVLRVGMAFRVVLPLGWAATYVGNYRWLTPAVMALSGLTFSAVTVAFNTMLYDMVPDDERKPAYFASWAAAISLIGAGTYLFSGWLVERLDGMHVLFGMEFSHLKIMFLLSAAVLVLPNLILFLVPDPRRARPGHTWSVMWRGNPLAFAYSSYAFSLATSEAGRAAAARAMGRSRSPMAIDPLVSALSDPSYKVRRAAAQGLGETRQIAAVEPLADQLHDEESDIRDEAAEALGRIATPKAVEPLLNAMNANDLRIRISAIRALAGMATPEIQERLMAKFSGPFEPGIFPALAEALSDAQDLRIVVPTIQATRRFRSPVIRLQLLECVCRALGAGALFYKLVSQDDLARTDRLCRLLRRVRRRLSESRALPSGDRCALLQLLGEVTEHFEEERYGEALEAARALAQRARQGSPSPVAAACADAISAFVDASIGDAPSTPVIIERAREVFPMLCVRQLLEHLS